MQIVPAILTKNKKELDGWLRQIKDAHKFERVQIDFIDGKFANNKSVTPLRVKLRWGLKFDAHLMVVEENVKQWADEARLAGFDRIIAQMESISHPEDFEALALDVHSPVEAIKPYLAKVKYVVVMSVEPGYGGQEFVDKAMEHVKELKKYKVRICVDGGVEKKHLEMLENLGVDEVAVGMPRVLEW